VDLDKVDQLDQQDHQVQEVQLDQLARRERMDHRDRVDLGVQLDQQALMDHGDRTEDLDCVATLVGRVSCDLCNDNNNIPYYCVYSPLSFALRTVHYYPDSDLFQPSQLPGEHTVYNVGH
jgi:hypothetical protein